MANDLEKIAAPECPVCRRRATAFFTEKNSYRLYRCRICGFIFTFPAPGVSPNLYSADYFLGAAAGFGYVNYDRDKEPMTETFKKYLARIAKQLPARGRLLDVGAATGFFLDLARRDGWETFGIELSEYAAHIARTKGLDVKAGTLEHFDAPAASFDVVTMLDLIEHLSDPRETIMAAARLLKPGGFLVINTPDAGSFWAKLFGRRWHLLVPPEHLQYFNRKNLPKLLADCGFETTFVGKIGKRFTLGYIFKTLYGWQRLFVWKALAALSSRTPFATLYLPVNLYDNFFLIAKK